MMPITNQSPSANNKNIPFVVLIGEAEMEQGIFTVKDMHEGKQYQYDKIGIPANYR